MKTFIALIGAVPENDMRLLQNVAHMRNLDVVVWNSLPDTLPLEHEQPWGFISFLPNDQSILENIFSGEMLGIGEKTPFFQRLDDFNSVPSFFLESPVYGTFHSPLSFASAWSIISSISHNHRLIYQNQELIRELVKYRKQKYQLIQIGTALSYENDLERLLTLILTVSRNLVGADAGSVYLRERVAPGGAFTDNLSFRISQNDSVVIENNEPFSIPINNESIAGYVAEQRCTVVLDDVEKLNENVPYRFSKDWSKRFGYRPKSILTVPLKNIAGEVVGVLQLINKVRTRHNGSKTGIEKEFTSFTVSDEDFVLSIASYAAVSIERAQLHENIHALFEGFLSSSIAAIDERDRVTSGHSRRVMGYTMAFIEAARNESDGPFVELASSEERIRQFKFAALLHDIGKIGVPESLLTKECRLNDGEYATLVAKIDYIRFSLQNHDGELPWKSIEDLDNDRLFLERVNQAGFLKDDDYNRLNELRKYYFITRDGINVPFLTDREWEALSVRVGNLTPKEREVINSHAVSTYRILSKIPWTRQLEMIPVIACQHHEKLDGSGYPYGLKTDQIYLESKILAVIDIYEALVSQDRSYKPKMAPEKALAILRKEVERNHLDAEVLEYFIAKKIYTLYLDNPTDT